MNPISILVVLAMSALAALAVPYGPYGPENIVDSYNNDGEYMKVVNEERYGAGPYGGHYGGPAHYGGPRPYGGPSYGGPVYGGYPSYDRDLNTNRNTNRDANANANANRDGTPRLKLNLLLINPPLT